LHRFKVEVLAPAPSLFQGNANTRRRRLTTEFVIKAFFGSNAVVAVVVLALITIFLFREGAGFFGQNLTSLRIYRRAGLEFVDLIRKPSEQHAALSRQLNALRLEEMRDSPNAAALQAFDQYAAQFSDASDELNGVLSDASDQALALRDLLLGAPKDPEATVQPAARAGLGQGMVALHANVNRFDAAVTSMKNKIEPLLATPPALTNPKAQKSLLHWTTDVRAYLAEFPAISRQLRSWNPSTPVPIHRAVTSFLFGSNWVTASFWQDWYGIIPLLVGSIMVAFVALFFAVPFGVASAIYVSEVATATEKRLIKPYIEFISAIPSVVLGFFGIAVVGQAIRAFSQMPFMKWVPFFPISERLNVFTAGCLLALMAVPTIFTLSEDALGNVPRGFKEASYALGANRLQTILRVLVPTSLSGIVSAVLLGLGRVIGETMVVLLCAGNRIAIPDFTQGFGLGAVFQPVHTMTGIIAQEMGEVPSGSIHYRALFMVGLVLFVLTLGINYIAQKIVARYRLSNG
jgi:phosphate transport system permease protein